MGRITSQPELLAQKEVKQLKMLLKKGTVSLAEVIAARRSYEAGESIINLCRRLHWSRGLLKIVLADSVGKFVGGFENYAEEETS